MDRIIKRKKINNKGFTLIELMLVLAVIAILSYMAAVSYIRYTTEAHRVSLERDVDSLSDVVSIYHANNNKWPVREDKEIYDHGIGGLEKLYLLDNREIGKDYTTLSDGFNNYAMAIGGEYEGHVFHIPTTRVSNRYSGPRPDEKQPITFQGTEYVDIDEVPATPSSYFMFQRRGDTYEVAGFDKIYVYKQKGGNFPKDLVIPSEYRGQPVTGIGDFAFKGMGLNSIVIPSSVRSLGYQSFISNNLKELIIPNTINEIASQAFASNRLEKITFPESVQRINWESFRSNNLTEVELPENLTYIGDRAFGINKLTSIDIPDTVQAIAERAFNNNLLPDDQAIIYARKPVVAEDEDEESLPKTVEDKTKIVSYGGQKRDNIVIPSYVHTIGTRAFHGNSLTSVTIPDSVTSIGRGAFNLNQLPDSQAFVYERTEGADGQAVIDDTKLVSYGGANRKLTSMPSSITRLDDLSMYDTGLESVVIPGNIQHIGNNAFGWNALRSIKIPETVESVGASAFHRNLIMEIEIEGAETTFGGNAFVNNGRRRDNANLNPDGETGIWRANKVRWYKLSTDGEVEEELEDIEDVEIDEDIENMEEIPE